jgi:hypothetical protein
MKNNPVIMYVVFGGLGAAVVGVVVYYILRWMKGSVRLEFENRAYRPGETIQGVVHLKCRKLVEANRFFVALLCHRVTRERRNGKTHTHRHEILRQELDVAPAGQFAAGTTQMFEFALPIPARQATVSTGNETLDSILRAVASFGASQRLEWSLEARVDARGVDLASRKRISINAV